MGQIISARRSSKRKLEPESEDQNQARKVSSERKLEPESEDQNQARKVSSERKLEPESEDQNQARKGLRVEDPDRDVQSNSTARSTSSSMATPTLTSSSESHWDHDVFLSFRAQSTSTTTSTSFSRRHWNYDVFLSFRGEDTRKNFTNRLHSALVQAKICTFLDEFELRKGKTISKELLDGIHGSMISIVVFSEGYASSRWCLDELVQIVNCRNTMGHTLLPIFYHVDPSVVRNQTGTFAEAFARHEKRFQNDMKKVQRWREALIEAANCAGWNCDSLANGYESSLIDKIVAQVSCEVDPNGLNVAHHHRVDKVKELLNLGTSDVRIVGIYGMGGIGKTTIAKDVYNQICYGFEGSSFLLNISKISEEYSGLLRLQEQLLSNILKEENLKIDNVEQGINLIENRLHGKRVLVVLDDVDDLRKLRTLVAKKWFGPGSRVIVTTRDKYMLRLLEVDEKYKVEELGEESSLQLFSLHAFNMRHPKKDCLELSIEVVKYCKGLPLALKVLGSFLMSRSVVQWKTELERLQRIPDSMIQKILRISFDSLDQCTKDIFLDIACFFVGMDKEYVIKILDGCDFFPSIGIQILIERSLVTIDNKNKLRMHDLIRDMGRQIVKEVSPKFPSKRCRLWFNEDVVNVLRQHVGTKAVEGLTLNLFEHEYLKTEAFAGMKNLRLLEINAVSLRGSYEHLSKELRWLCWPKCPLKFLPLNFHLEHLIVLDMQHSNFRQVWKQKKRLCKLKVLNLSNSKYLTKLPDFSLVPMLEIMILEGCTSLVQLHESIRWLKRLVSLNLNDCTSLVQVHESIGCLTFLQSLNLKNCTNLLELPRSIINLESLEILDLSGCSGLKKLSEQLPSSLKNLKSVSLSGCSRLTKLPNFLQATHLERLVLGGSTWLRFTSPLDSEAEAERMDHPSNFF